MSTAHKTDEEKKEFFDTPEELDRKVEILAELIKKSKHFIAFTGAGISTSAGVADFRSGINTVLPTGPGKWEKMATGSQQKPKISVNTTSAIPTPTHMALIKLQEAGYLKFLISQNTDGLHRRSGFPIKNLAELHGNSNLEICRNPSCGKQFLRDYRVRTNRNVHGHETERKCENCGGTLYDTIINFGESLPEKELKAGWENARRADLCLSLGSSLRVTPAASMPEEVARHGGKHVIVNLQATPLDEGALRIDGFIDDVMIKLMEKLRLEIPPFILRRRVMVKKIKDENNKEGLFIRGVDEFGTPYQLFQRMKATFSESQEMIDVLREPEPICIFPKKSNMSKDIVTIKFRFQGHYQEPDYTIDVDLQELKLDQPVYYLLEYNPQVKQWINCSQTTLKNMNEEIPKKGGGFFSSIFKPRPASLSDLEKIK